MPILDEDNCLSRIVSGVSGMTTGVITGVLIGVDVEVVEGDGLVRLIWPWGWEVVEFCAWVIWDVFFVVWIEGVWAVYALGWLWH